MSFINTDVERSSQEYNSPPRTANRCRIPQRLPLERQRSPETRPRVTPDPSERNKKAKFGNKSAKQLPNQEVIQKREELEVFFDRLDVNKFLEEATSECETMPDDLLELKSNFDEKNNQLSIMKMDLANRQRAVLETYASLKRTQTRLMELGEELQLPPTEQFQIMNLTKVSTCHTSSKAFDPSSLTPDVRPFYEVPTKLVATCEQVLLKRQEIIDWFDKLKENHGITMSKFSKKILEFNAESEMLTSTLNSIKAEFLGVLNEIINQIKRGQTESMALQVRTEELTYEISELNSQNLDLRKQIQTSSHLQSQHLKERLEELDKELKEERSKKALLRNHLTRAEGQIKTAVERGTQLGAALEQARSQNWNLERTVQELNEQNQKLQSDFDKELNKLTESIRENTEHLEEIADAREKLQAEKEDLEKRLAELSENYNESMQIMKLEMNTTLARLLEAENNYSKESEEKNNMKQEIEKLSNQVLELEIKHNEIQQTLQERENQLAQALVREAELEATKNQLQLANTEVEECRNQLTKQNETIIEIETRFKETIALEKALRSDLAMKEEYIAELEKKDSLLEQQLQENESKLEFYVSQLKTLEGQIQQLQTDFGEFENLDQLHAMINEQRAKLNEVTRDKEQLSEILNKKESLIEEHLEQFMSQDSLLQERDEMIQMLRLKEEEHANIIKLLRNNLEARAQAENETRHQLAEKNTEIESLMANLDTRKSQISELQNIIQTLEDQLRKVNLQKRKDQDKLNMLEQAIAQYENYHIEAKRSQENPIDNLDNLIKILEDELGSAYDPQFKDEEQREKRGLPTYIGDVNQEDDNIRCYDGQGKILPQVIITNFVRKTCNNLSRNDEPQRGESLDRKKALTQMDRLKVASALEPGAMNTTPATKLNLPRLVHVGHPRDHLLLKNLQCLTSNQLREDRKYKMFKLAGHKLY